MRPLRLLLSLSTCLVAICILSYVAAHRTGSSSDSLGRSSPNRLGTYFSWHSSSLFPPSAIISLTDDNSTFFLARPANFGPPLPTKGLSGQIWIGSGFGDDGPGRGVVAAAEGELGCSDVPGWGDGSYGSAAASNNDAQAKSRMSQDGNKAAEARASKSKRGDTSHSLPDTRTAGSDGQAEAGDGTDDHLHRPQPQSPERAEAGAKLAHADIQSLQETAEIAGKVVLLSRGGCGFLEKAKWVQRRGGVALIVGDNVRGGALVTMYARGDTSNVTIPSLFTSYSTATLLSKLIPSGGLVTDPSLEEPARTGLVGGDKSTNQGGGSSSGKTDTKGASSIKDQPLVDLADGQDSSSSGKSSSTEAGKDDEDGGSWLSAFFGASADPHQDSSRRPPSSGKIDWILQKDFVDEHPEQLKPKSTKLTKVPATSTKKALHEKTTKAAGGGFVIGVQDWRDPDLVYAELEAIDDSRDPQEEAAESKPTPHNKPKGGSITPGSGEYSSSDSKHPGKDAPKDSPAVKADQQSTKSTKSSGWLSLLPWAGSRSQKPRPNTEMHVASPLGTASPVDKTQKPKPDSPDHEDADEPHEGLWVTLTPTSMSSSPFFDTLLVLVISPLVTLTIVYALLLLRSRIRRRRWRAPKSVVDRLPVRTYHTIPSTPGSASSNSPSDPPTSPAPTSTTPLLHSSARPISQGRSRPRSRTEGEVPASGTTSSHASPSLDHVQEKREAGLAEWRRRYVGRQKECVVCLEEYIDGISRVMSLPCGHEFHADCITPWLTTRRRTCPICKGDVVRSLAHAPSSSSSPSNRPLLQHSRYRDMEEGDIAEGIDEAQESVAAARNDDPTSAEPVSREDEAFEDLERGLEEDRSQ